MNKEDLADWVARAQQGDRAALEEILSHSEPAMLRLAGKVCHPADAEDAVQEVMFRASQQVGALRVGAAFVGWSMKMLLRECLRLKRRAARWVMQVEEEMTSASTNEVIELADALAVLSVTSREILLEREVLGHSAGETAKRLGISEESAKSRLRRARVELRKVWLERSEGTGVSG